MKNNLVLIGFMGTGKTSVGKIISEKLGKKFIEMDEKIVEKAGKSIPEIFSQDGEIKFREIEMEVAKDLSEKENVVISGGGGIILNKLNIDYLKKSSIIILLEATAKDIYDRILIEGKEKRPLLNKDDPMGEIKKLLIFRRPFYNAAADFKVSTFRKVPEQIADEVISVLKNGGKKPAYGNLKELFNDLEVGGIFSDDKNAPEKNTIDAEQFIIDKCINWKTLNPLDLAKQILLNKELKPERSEFTGIIPGIILSIFANYQRQYGQIIIEISKKTDKKEKFEIPLIDSSKIIIGIKRGMAIPYGSCAYLGISETAIGVGIATSVIVGATPKQAHLMELVNTGTLIALNDLIKKGLLRRNDWVECIDSVLISAIKFFSDRFKLNLLQ